ncbi:TPA: hypothetical protein MYM07_000972 [Klebsiella pneumoniae]|nr:hypothetical protein [Klebsiella pneumoniae]
MSLQTNLKGRLRNTSLPKSHGLMPVFEAVVNSIHSIEEMDNASEGKIVLRINRASQGSLDLDTKSQPPIIGFTITDNGCGFDEANFKSFKTLDSDHKIDKGCRGVGRLMWLKVFALVEVESHFFDVGGKLKKRAFRFNDKLGVHGEKVVEATSQKPGTLIKLVDYDESFRKQVPAKGLSIANQLLEHVLWYFVRQGSAPKILLEDTDEVFDLDHLLEEHMHASAFLETITIRDYQFDLTHIKFRASVNKKSINWHSAQPIDWLKKNLFRESFPACTEKFQTLPVNLLIPAMYLPTTLINTFAVNVFLLILQKMLRIYSTK